MSGKNAISVFLHDLNVVIFMRKIKAESEAPFHSVEQAGQTAGHLKLQVGRLLENQEGTHGRFQKPNSGWHAR
jgi:hypothetical protein